MSVDDGAFVTTGDSIERVRKEMEGVRWTVPFSPSFFVVGCVFAYFLVSIEFVGGHV